MISTICGISSGNTTRSEFSPRHLVFAIFALTWSVAPAFAMDRATLEIVQPGGRHLFLVELAETPAERERGLMERTSLPLNAGMLFMFERVEPIQMWMKNTLISLDMIFADAEGRVVAVIPRTEPMSLRIISSGVAAKSVLEVRAGTAERLDIRVGDHMILRR